MTRSVAGQQRGFRGRFWASVSAFILGTQFGTAAPARAQEQVDTVQLAAVERELTAVPDSIESVRRRVDAHGEGDTGPGPAEIRESIRQQQLLILRSAGKLMTQVEVGSRSTNAILTSFNFGLNIGFTANPLSSPTLTTWIDRAERFLDFAPPLAFGASMALSDDEGAQINTLALSFLAVQAFKTLTNRPNARADSLSAALSTAQAVSDYLNFNRSVYTDARRLANLALTTRNADTALARDIEVFMRTHGSFPTELNDPMILADTARFRTYIRDALPLLERFRLQLERVQAFYTEATATTQTYRTHFIFEQTANPPPQASRLASDARKVVDDLARAATLAADDWNALRKVLEITPSRVANLNEFYTLEQLYRTVR